MHLSRRSCIWADRDTAEGRIKELEAKIGPDRAASSHQLDASVAIMNAWAASLLAFRYLRHVGPDSAFGNVAEV